MEKEGTEFVLEGFSFQGQEEFHRAEEDFQKIKYFNSKVNYTDLRMVQALYEKAISEKVFQTIMGSFYLKELRDYLVKENETLDGILSPIPVSGTGKADVERKKPDKKQELQEKKLQNKTQQLQASIILNVVMAIAIIAMFVIPLTSGQANILNYERVLTDRYAAWEQELTEREQVVKQMELEILRGE